MIIQLSLKWEESAQRSRPRRLARWCCHLALGTLSAYSLSATVGTGTGLCQVPLSTTAADLWQQRAC